MAPTRESRLRLPTRHTDVDAGMLTQALRDGGRLGPTGVVSGLRMEPFAEGVGISGSLTVLQLSYRGDPADIAGAPPSAILKLPALAEENQAVNKQYGMYVREGRFYATLAAHLTARSPACFWTAHDLEQGTSAMLLEDLRGGDAGCQVTGATLGQAQRAMDALAAVHAAGWARPLPAADPWLERFDGGVWIQTGATYRAVWPAFAERFGAVLPDGALDLGQRVQDAFEDLLRAATAEAPLTLCHGDARLDNMIFAIDPDDQAPGRLALLDWQLPHRGPGIEDVAMFLSQSVPVALRRAHEAGLVRRWHHALSERIGAVAEDYPLDLAYRHYRRLCLYGTLYPVIVGGTMDTANERGLALNTAMAVRSFTAALDLDAAEFLP